VEPASGRIKVLRVFSGPKSDLGSTAKEIVRAELEQDDSDP